MAGRNDARRIHLLFSLLIFLILIMGAWRLWLIPKHTLVEQNFPLMGTFVSVRAVAAKGYEKDYDRAILEARKELERFVNRVNAYDSESEVSEINRMAGVAPVSVSREVLGVVRNSLFLGDLSDGAFDITFSAVGRIWKLDPEAPVIPSASEIEQALSLVDYRKVVLNEEEETLFLPEEGMRIDLGGIAKGSALEVIGNALLDREIQNAVIDGGGDLLCLGKNRHGQPWRVGIRDPRDRERIIGILGISDLAVATSGDYERMVEIDGVRYHHILDPRTGMPVKGCISVTVIHPSAEMADGLATAVFVLGPEKGIEMIERVPGAEVLVIDPEFRSHQSSGFETYMMRWIGMESR